jgi:hypothetical protein
MNKQTRPTNALPCTDLRPVLRYAHSGEPPRRWPSAGGGLAVVP